MVDRDAGLHEIELFTESYWITGHLSRELSSDAAGLASLLNLGQYALSGRGLLESGRLVDVLNRDTGYVSVADALIRSLHPAERLEQSVAEVAVNLAEVLCASPSTQTRQNPPPRAAPPAAREDRERRRVQVQTGAMVVTGELHVMRGSDPVAAYFRREHTFIPLTGATATYLPDPERRWERDVLIVNMRRTQLMSVAAPVSPES